MPLLYNYLDNMFTIKKISNRYLIRRLVSSAFTIENLHTITISQDNLVMDSRIWASLKS